jgi:hypothetical protein
MVSDRAGMGLDFGVEVFWASVVREQRARRIQAGMKVALGKGINRTSLYPHGSRRDLQD